MMPTLDETELPISEIHTDIFSPLADDAIGLSGEETDPYQSDPEQGSPVELGGQDTEDDTQTIAFGHSSYGPVTTTVHGLKVHPAVTQNLTGQSDSPPAATGVTQGVSGSGPAAPTVPLGNDLDGSSEIGQTIASHGPSLAAATLASPSSAQAAKTGKSASTQPTFFQTSQSGLSFGGNVVLFFVLGVVGSIVAYSLVKG